MLNKDGQPLDPMQLEVATMFKNKPDALQFICVYAEYVHCIDDCVDEIKSVSRIQELTRLAAFVFNSNFWIKHREHLIVVEKLIHNAYYDSVLWEKSEDKWKVRDSKVMNQRGYDMLLAVVWIEFGDTVLSEFSKRFREYSHMAQGHHELD